MLKLTTPGLTLRCCDTHAMALARAQGAVPSLLRQVAAAHERIVGAVARNDRGTVLEVLMPDALVIMDALGQGRIAARAFTALVLASFAEEHDILYHEQRLLDAQLVNDGLTCTTLLEQRFLVRARSTGQRTLLTIRCGAVWVAGEGGWRVASAYPTHPVETERVEDGAPIKCSRCGKRMAANLMGPARVQFLNPRTSDDDATSRRFALIEIE